MKYFVTAKSLAGIILVLAKANKLLWQFKLQFYHDLCYVNHFHLRMCLQKFLASSVSCKLVVPWGN